MHEANDHEGPGEEPLENDAWDANFSEDDERTEDDVQEDEEFPAGISLAEDDIEDDEEELPVRDVEEDGEPDGSGVRGPCGSAGPIAGRGAPNGLGNYCVRACIGLCHRSFDLRVYACVRI